MNYCNHILWMRFLRTKYSFYGTFTCPESLEIWYVTKEGMTKSVRPFSVFSTSFPAPQNPDSQDIQVMPLTKYHFCISRFPSVRCWSQIVWAPVNRKMSTSFSVFRLKFWPTIQSWNASFLAHNQIISWEEEHFICCFIKWLRKLSENCTLI